MKETLKEIAFWIIAILFLGAFTCFFSSCESGGVKTGELTIREYKYDSCIYIRLSNTPLIHSATCNNPKHSCICYNEVYE